MRQTEYIKNKILKADIIVDLPDEVWMNCVGYEGNYMVSNYGRIKSVEREIPGSDRCGGSFRLGQKLIKFKIGTTGYYSFTMCKNGGRKDSLVHRIVALAFIPNPNNYPYINHKNLNKLDNRVDNLEWCTQKINIHHAIENNCIPRFYGEDTSGAKLSNEMVMEILNAEGRFGDIAKKYGISRGNVGYIKSGKTWSSVTGRIWSRQKDYYQRKK